MLLYTSQTNSASKRTTGVFVLRTYGLYNKNIIVLVSLTLLGIARLCIDFVSQSSHFFYHKLMPVFAQIIYYFQTSYILIPRAPDWPIDGWCEFVMLPANRSRYVILLVKLLSRFLTLRTSQRCAYENSMYLNIP